MKRSQFLHLLIALITLITMTACSGLSDRQMFWDTENGGSGTPTVAAASYTQSRQPLEVPPELRAEVELPMANAIAVNKNSAELPKQYAKAVAGKAVSLDARIYDASAAKVFSAVVDAMTSLNLPVDSVDSPSGIITTDWVRSGANSSNMISSLIGGAGDLSRHRFIVRIYRLKSELNSYKSKLEIRMLNQKFVNRHWVNIASRNQLYLQLFSSVEEQLARVRAEALKREAAP